MAELKEQAKPKVKLPASPSKEECAWYSMPSQPTDEWLNKVVATHPKVFWIEGCEAPRLRDFKIKLELKPGATPYAAQEMRSCCSGII